LLDMALESGHVVKPNNGWYAKVDMETGEVEAKKVRLVDTEAEEFWNSILADETFKEWIRNRYQFTSNVAGKTFDKVAVEDDEDVE